MIGGVIGDRAGWVINVPVNTDVESRDVVDVTGFGRYLVQQVVRRSVATAIVLYCQEDL